MLTLKPAFWGWFLSCPSLCRPWCLWDQEAWASLFEGSAVGIGTSKEMQSVLVWKWACHCGLQSASVWVCVSLWMQSVSVWVCVCVIVDCRVCQYECVCAIVDVECVSMSVCVCDTVDCRVYQCECGVSMWCRLCQYECDVPMQNAECVVVSVPQRPWCCCRKTLNLI